MRGDAARHALPPQPQPAMPHTHGSSLLPPPFAVATAPQSFGFSSWLASVTFQVVPPLQCHTQSADLLAVVAQPQAKAWSTPGTAVDPWNMTDLRGPAPRLLGSSTVWAVHLFLAADQLRTVCGSARREGRLHKHPRTLRAWGRQTSTGASCQPRRLKAAHLHTCTEPAAPQAHGGAVAGLPTAGCRNH